MKFLTMKLYKTNMAPACCEKQSRNRDCTAETDKRVCYTAAVHSIYKNRCTRSLNNLLQLL
jgi:hypothetical protein